MISRLPQLQKSTEPWCAEENLQQISGEFQACHDIFLFMSTCIQPAGFSGGLDWIFGIPLGVSLGVIPNHRAPLPFVEMMHINSKVVSYNALISACEKGQQWQLGLSLFTLMNCQALRSNHGNGGFVGIFQKMGQVSFFFIQARNYLEHGGKIQYVVVLLLHGFFRVKWIGWSAPFSFASGLQNQTIWGLAWSPQHSKSSW